VVDFPAMPSADYIRFDEIEDVLASVDLVALLAPLVREKPQLWKWLIVGAHDALQGAMVCAFADSTQTSILTKKSAAKVLDWLNADFDTRGEHPHERLATFRELLNRCIAGASQFEPLALSPDKLKDIERLHRHFRNQFAHFVPKGWSIEKLGLPRIIEAALDTVNELLNRVTHRMEEDQQKRLHSMRSTAKLALRSHS
jgi:hypothetical protein